MSMHAFIVNSTHFKNRQQDSDTLIISEPDIESIRSIGNFLSRRPLKSKVNTVIIDNSHKLSLIAQNAILKVLEEPVGSAEIYLITDSPDQLLPTILSRVQVISSPSTKTFKKKSLESITTREELLEHLDYLENEIHKKPQDLGLKIYDLVYETRKYVRANCNLKLCINHLASRL